jgi:hypothetical protein
VDGTNATTRASRVAKSGEAGTQELRRLCPLFASQSFAASYGLNATVSKLFIDKIEKLNIFILICPIHRMRYDSPHLV